MACEMGLQRAAGVLLDISGPHAANAEDDMKSTPLHAAVQSGSLPLVRFLLDKGATAGKADRSGVCPLHYAASAGHLDIIDLLLQRGAKVDCLSGAGTPLHWAAGENKCDSVKKLIEHGANKDIQDSDGISPVSMAIVSGAEDVACLLLDAGAQVSNHGLPHGMTLLHYSAELGLDQVVPRMVATPYGKAAARQETEGRRPIHMAAEAGYDAIAQLLLPVSGLPLGTTLAEVMEAAHSITAAEWDLYTSEEGSPFRLDTAMSLSDAGTSTGPTPSATPMSTVSMGAPPSLQGLSPAPVSPMLDAPRPVEPVTSASSPDMLAGAAEQAARGDQMMADNDFEGALQSYTDAIRCHGADARLWGKRAGTQMVNAQCSGQPDCKQQILKAYGDALVATEIDPQSPFARHVLGKALALLGHEEDAEAQLALAKEFLHQSPSDMSSDSMAPLLRKLDGGGGLSDPMEHLRTPPARSSPIKSSLRLSGKNPVSPLRHQLKKLGRSAPPVVVCPAGALEEHQVASPFSKMRSSLRPMRLRIP